MDTREIVKIIEFWNNTIKTESLFRRDIMEEIDIASKEIVDIIGPRRCGKTSLLKLLMTKIDKNNSCLYINFEDPFFVSNDNARIIEDIIDVYHNYFSKNLRFVFFDEIQVIKDWEKVIRKYRDAGKLKIFVTGSSSKLLSKEISSLLTGRHLTYSILPLSFKEFLDFKKFGFIDKKEILLKETEIKKYFLEYIQNGGFPEITLSNNLLLLKNYFFDIVQKDVIMRYNLREKEILEKLTVYILSNSTKLTSIDSLKKLYGISYHLVNTYLEYLKQAFLIFELPQFSYSLKTQQKAIKKYFALDTGLVNQISIKFSEDKGRMLENIVFLDLLRKGEEIFYLKLQNGYEVDFVVVSKNKVKKLIQVTWDLHNEKTESREINNLIKAMEYFNLYEGIILTFEHEEEIVKGKYTIKIIPVTRWLLSN
jgi:uncharacterized protein